MALDDLPGTITQRQLVQDSDSDDEEDFGTFALLKTGNEKKAALREKERLKNLQSMEIGGKAAEATEAPVPEVPAATAASPKLSPKPPSPKATAGAKRPRRGAGAGRASRSKAAASNSPQVHDLDGEEELDEADRKLAQSNRENDERQRRMREQLRALDEDDDDEPPPAARGGGARGSSSSGRSGAFAPESLWLSIVAGRDGQGKRELMRCQTSQPLEARLVQRIAASLGYLPERMALWAGERQLDVRRSALELGLVDKQEVRVEELAPPPPPKGLKLKLSREGERDGQRVEMVHPPEATFGELLAAYCAQAGLQPAGYRLQFDGDTLPPTGTPADADMEDGDLVEVVKAR